MRAVVIRLIRLFSRERIPAKVVTIYTVVDGAIVTVGCKYYGDSGQYIMGIQNIDKIEVAKDVGRVCDNIDANPHDKLYNSLFSNVGFNLKSDKSFIFMVAYASKVEDGGRRVHHIMQQVEHANKLNFRVHEIIGEDGSGFKHVKYGDLNSKNKEDVELSMQQFKILFDSGQVVFSRTSNLFRWIMMLMNNKRLDIPFDPGGIDPKLKLEDEFSRRRGE
ncbi:hypothetical protein QVD17_42194 [Tagetes erecta]|uniref:Uncharacterized protein n=1 Tax=Tagetes erecta TaxID=13708 RepID=A0AAD8JQ72_TARER|nr:hypothetical protein QVD17_42194 [Tagetes erecta]